MPPKRPSTPPKGLEAGGKALWREVTAAFGLDPGERDLLTEACRTVDRLNDLDAAIRDGGVVVDGRVSGSLVEARQQQAILARLLQQLRPISGDASGSVSDAARAAADIRWKGARRGA